MNCTFLLHKALFVMCIFALFSFGYGKTDNDSAQNSQSLTRAGAESAPKDQPRENPPAYRLVNKTYKGQQFSILHTADTPSYKEPLATIEKKAMEGDPAAQYELGCRLGRGEGVTRDLQKSLKWLHKAARQDYAEAQFELATMYSLGVVCLPLGSDQVKTLK